MLKSWYKCYMWNERPKWKENCERELSSLVLIAYVRGVLCEEGKRVMVQKWPNSMKSIIFPTPNLEMFFNKLRDTWQSGPNSIWPCTKWNFRRVEKAAFPCYRHTYEDEKNYSKLFENKIYFRSLLLMVFFFLHIYKIYLESWWIVENPTMWPTFIRVHYL